MYYRPAAQNMSGIAARGKYTSDMGLLYIYDLGILYYSWTVTADAIHFIDNIISMIHLRILAVVWTLALFCD